MLSAKLQACFEQVLLATLPAYFQFFHTQPTSALNTLHDIVMFKIGNERTRKRTALMKVHEVLFVGRSTSRPDSSV
jgi:hypothetical protein